MRNIIAILLSLIASATGAQEPVRKCDQIPASEGLKFRTDPRTSSNFGVEVGGFVVPADGAQVIHGVDVSKYQDAVDFEMLKTCGGQFAYVRLSAGSNPDNELRYRDLWKNARSVGFYVGGYHNLNLVEPKKPFTELSADEQSQLVLRNVDLAEGQAQTFLTRLAEMRDLEVKDASDPGANRMLPPVIDLSWRPQSKFGTEAIEAFAEGYRRAICTWIDTVRTSKAFTIPRVMLFVNPQVYADMKLDVLGCLKPGDGLWVSAHTRTGDDLAHADEKTAAILSRMCSAGRCWFQQYTSFGQFALFGANASIDLDRFLGSRDELLKILIRTDER